MSTFQRRHYKAIGAMIASVRPAPEMPREWQSGCEAATEYLAEKLADYFAADNPLFNRVKFAKACRGED